MLTPRTSVLAVTVLLAAVVAQAQPPDQMYRIGVLLHDGAPPGLLEAFRAELQDRGYVDGKTITIETRNAAGRSERLGALADELVRLQVDVMLSATHVIE